MSGSLKKKTINGIFWSALGKIFVNGSIFIFGILLARILSPADFGTIGMIVFFLAISKVIVEGGFTKALIQNQNNSQEDYSTVFYTNFFVSVFLYLLLYLAAPVIADFYNTPILKNIVRISGLGIIISSFTIVQRTRFSLVIDFKTQTKVTFISILIAGATSLFMAYKGFGVWSLVAKELIQNFLIAVIFWRIGKWVPSFVFSLKSFRFFTSYSLKLLGADLINVLYQNIIIFIVGKLYGASNLGFYTRAKAFGDTSSLHASQIIQGVSFPVLSNLKHNPDAFKNAVIKFFRLSAFITFPVTMGLFVMSKEVVIVLLTEKWLPSVPLIQVICLVGFFYPLISINQNVINVLGNSRLFLRIEIFKIALVIINIIITYSYGLKIMILGQAVVLFVTYLVYTYFLRKAINYGIWSQTKNVLSIFFLSLVMAVIVFFCKSFFATEIVKLIFGLTAGGTIYLTGAYLLNFPEIKEIVQTIQNIFRKDIL